MVNFIRSFCITICWALFNFIPVLYNLFYDLAANHDLISSTKLDEFSRNIYVLVSVVMLFAFAVKAIESIINPDMLFDSKKGFASVIKRSVIALVLIVGVPFGFELFYQVQDEVMAKSLIEKIIIGVSINNNETGEENLAEKSGAGQMLASTALNSVLYPKEEDTCTEYEDSDVCSKYNDAMIDIGKLANLIPHINEKVGDGDDADYVLTYEGAGLLSIVVGVVLIYMLAIFCIDTALRLVKMAFLELTAPISIVAYIFGGNDILKKWWKELSGTAFSLFGRVAALALMIYVLSLLPDFIDNSNFGPVEGKVINLLIIMALLMFVKEAPNMIERIFGIKIGGKGGIAGRLGSMAGVGNIAKSAWEKVRNVGMTAAGTALGLAGAAVGAMTSLAGLGFAGGAAGLGALGGFAGKKISDGLKNTDTGQKIRRFGSTVGSFASAGNPIKGIKEAKKTYKESPTTAAIKAAKKAEKERAFATDVGVDYNTGTIIGDKDDKLKARRSTKAFDSKVDKISGVSNNERNAIKEKISADRTKATMDELKSHNDKISAIFDSTIANTKDPDKIRNLSNLKSQYLGGKISLDDMANKIASMAGNEFTEADANQIIGKLNSINNMANANGQVKSLMNEIGGISGKNITSAVSAATTMASNADDFYKTQYDAASDSAKEQLDIIDKNAKIISTEYSKEIGSSTSDKYQKVSMPDGTSINSDDEPTGLDIMYEGYLGAEEERKQKASSTTSGNSNTSSNSSSQSGNSSSQSTSQSNNQNTSNTSSDSSTSSGNSSTTSQSNSTGNTNSSNSNSSSYENNNYGGNNNSSSQQMQDLSGFFDGLSKDIRDANAATNSILNDQLKTQQSSLDESRKQNTTLNNISSGVNNLNNTVDQMNNNIKNFSNTNNKNLKDMSQKLDDINKNNNE